MSGPLNFAGAREWNWAAKTVAHVAARKAASAPIVDVPPAGLRARYCDAACGKLNAEPHMHLQHCLVAPVPGVHGGMREAPVLSGKVAKWSPGDGKYRLIYEGHSANGKLLACTDLNISSGHFAEVRDLVLMAFYLPPAAPSDTSARLPVDGDPELECVAARATHEPERWKTGRRS